MGSIALPLEDSVVGRLHRGWCEAQLDKRFDVPLQQVVVELIDFRPVMAAAFSNSTTCGLTRLLSETGAWIPNARYPTILRSFDASTETLTLATLAFAFDAFATS